MVIIKKILINYLWKCHIQQPLRWECCWKFQIYYPGWLYIFSPSLRMYVTNVWINVNIHRLYTFEKHCVIYAIIMYIYIHNTSPRKIEHWFANFRSWFYFSMFFGGARHSHPGIDTWLFFLTSFRSIFYCPQSLAGGILSFCSKRRVALKCWTRKTNNKP